MNPHGGLLCAGLGRQQRSRTASPRRFRSSAGHVQTCPWWLGFAGVTSEWLGKLSESCCGPRASICQGSSWHQLGSPTNYKAPSVSTAASLHPNLRTPGIGPIGSLKSSEVPKDAQHAGITWHRFVRSTICTARDHLGTPPPLYMGLYTQSRSRHSRNVGPGKQAKEEAQAMKARLDF